MLVDVVGVKVLEGYDLLLNFSDGKEGIVNIKKLISFKGIFSPLKDYGYFTSVKINPDIGTLCWDNGADLAPDSLYIEARD